MFTVDPRQLVDTRVQLHWAAQLLSASADATLEALDDDSHTNFEWRAQPARLVCRAGPSISVADFTLTAGDDELPLQEHSLQAAADWLGKRINARIKIRDYDMPSHPVALGQPFDPNPAHLDDIAAWYTLAQEALADCGTLRVWPHHFDLGFLSPSQVEGRSIGGGFTIGDAHCPYPYFYVNAYGIDRPDSLPPLAEGVWSEEWLGAVLPFWTLLDRGEVNERVGRFIASGVKACQQLIAA